MKLAIVHPFLYTKGGAERVVLKIAQHFNAKIYCSRYIPEQTYTEFRDLEIEIIKTKFQKLFPEFLPMRVKDAITAGYQFYTKKLDGYDVVNAQGTPSEWIRNLNKPVVWYCHTPNREAFDLYEWRMSQRNVIEKILYWSAIQPYKTVEYNVVPKIEYIFANSNNTRERLKEYLNRDSEILNPGIDYEEFYCNDYQKYFFYPSRITPEKRFEFSIKAFKEFKKYNPGWKLIIAGALLKERKEHIQYYENIRKLLGNDGEILTNIGFDKMKELYSNCYSVLYTPINEDFGIITLEALASYKPCIAVNEGGPREIIINGENGFLINSEKEMVERMSLLADDSSLTERIGKNGRSHVEKNFSWNRFFERFEDVCKSISKQ